jgi:hypothetical protein
MIPKYRRRFVLLLPVIVTLIGAAQTVRACVCTDGDNSTLGRFESARFVVVNKIVSVHKEPRVEVVSTAGRTTHEPIMTIVSIKMIVEKVYKGNLKVGSEMIFGQGESNCVVDFREEEVGAKFLFYLQPSNGQSKLWYANSCDRSLALPGYSTRYIEDAAHDLLYLDKLNEARGRTRLSGTLNSYYWSIADGGAVFKKQAGRKVHIVGNGKSYEALTDNEGVYEIYDLPVGTYAVRPDVKEGWEIDERSVFGGGSSVGNEAEGGPKIRLQPGRHAYSDFIFKVNNRLSGRVLDKSGRPLRFVCLRLLPTQPNVSPHFERIVCTDADGRFGFEEIPFASYVVVINPDDKTSSRQPFRRFYYPDAADREQAQVITFVEGNTRYLLDIHVPEVREVVTVTGKVLSADGKPVVFAGVSFTSDQTDATIDGNAFRLTDQQGNFSLDVLKGLPGALSAAVMLNPEEFRNCSSWLRVRGKISLDRKTEAVRVQADSRIDGVELKFPFPSCNGEKIQSQIKVD